MGSTGVGKTTTTAKLAKHLIERRKKKVLTVSGDVYRPAAIEQLKVLGRPIPFSSSSFTSEASEKRGGGEVKCCLGISSWSLRTAPWDRSGSSSFFVSCWRLRFSSVEV